MTTQNRNIFIIFSFFVLITACSNQPEIISATEDQVIVKAPVDKFTEAFDLAKKECQRNSRTTLYITDGTDKLEEVAFECIAPVVEEVAEADTESQTEDAPAEEEPEIEAESEEAPVEEEPQTESEEVITESEPQSEIEE